MRTRSNHFHYSPPLAVLYHARRTCPCHAVLRRARAEKTFDGHEAVRYGDRAYVASSGSGAVNVYNTRTLRLVRSLQLWQRNDHINTVALTPSTILVMLHRMGAAPSEVHIVERARHVSVGRIPDVGRGAHGLALWGDELIMLDSNNGAVVARSLSSSAPGDAPLRVVWSDVEPPASLKGFSEPWRPAFLKGLAVVNGVAYFGMSPPARRLLRSQVNTTLVAVELSSGREVLRRPMPTRGLLNLIAHPNYLAVPPAPARIPLRVKAARPPGREVPPSQRVTSLGAVDVAELRRSTLAQWGELWEGQQDYGHLFPGLTNYGTIFQGVQNAKLLFSAEANMLRNSKLAEGVPSSAFASLPWPQTPRTRVVFPAWRLLRDEIIPILDEARLAPHTLPGRALCDALSTLSAPEHTFTLTLSPALPLAEPHRRVSALQVFARRLRMPDYASRVLRLQMNRLPSGARVHPHADRGYYSTNAHRYHIPVIASRCVRFEHESGDGLKTSARRASALPWLPPSVQPKATAKVSGRRLSGGRLSGGRLSGPQVSDKRAVKQDVDAADGSEERRSEERRASGRYVRARVAGKAAYRTVGKGRGCIMSHSCTRSKAYRNSVRRLEDETSWEEIPFKEGEVFEVNNIIKHRVEQTGPWERVTLIIDLLEQRVDHTVEIRSGCRSWFEAACYRSANVSEAEWRGERQGSSGSESGIGALLSRFG